MANDNTSWWSGANDFLGELSKTTTKVNEVKKTIDNFGLSDLEIERQNAELKTIQEVKRLQYQSQVSGAQTSQNLGIDNNTLLIGGAVLLAFLILG